MSYNNIYLTLYIEKLCGVIKFQLRIRQLLSILYNHGIITTHKDNYEKTLQDGIPIIALSLGAERCMVFSKIRNGPSLLVMQPSTQSD